MIESGAQSQYSVGSNSPDSGSEFLGLNPDLICDHAQIPWHL